MHCIVPNIQLKARQLFGTWPELSIVTWTCMCYHSRQVKSGDIDCEVKEIRILLWKACSSNNSTALKLLVNLASRSLLTERKAGEGGMLSYKCLQ